jgi:hypothetical protein
MDPKPSTIREKVDQTNENRREVAACILHISTDALECASSQRFEVPAPRLTGPSASALPSMPSWRW